MADAKKRPLVLAGLDLSEASPGVLRRALGLAEALDGAVAAVHVAPSPPGPISGGVGTYTDASALREEICARAASELASLASELDPERRRIVDTAVIAGEAAPAIIERAAALAADVIVVGAHAPGLPAGRLGSTTARVVRHAPCDVVVVRERRGARPAGSR